MLVPLYSETCATVYKYLLQKRLILMSSEPDMSNIIIKLILKESVPYKTSTRLK